MHWPSLPFPQGLNNFLDSSSQALDLWSYKTINSFHHSQSTCISTEVLLTLSTQNKLFGNKNKVNNHKQHFIWDEKQNSSNLFKRKLYGQFRRIKQYVIWCGLTQALWITVLLILLGHPNKLFHFPSPDRPTFFQNTIKENKTDPQFFYISEERSFQFKGIVLL